jgi:hypothetical protein
LSGKERYRTNGFNEIALIYGCTEKSYRKVAELIKRVCHQQECVPSRSLRFYVENEGMKIIEQQKEETRQILLNAGYADNGTPLMIAPHSKREKISLDAEKVSAIAAEISKEENIDAEKLLANPVVYENSEKTVSISVDDVVVKKQKDSRPDNEKESRKDKKKRLQHTVAHIQNKDKDYVLVGNGLPETLRLVAAFLVKNDLMKQQLMFFTDGQRSLKNNIFEIFGWTDARLILDWPHLVKKCSELLSSGMNNRKARNQVLDKLKKLLWHGLVDQATLLLQQIDKSKIKNKEAIEKLEGYFKRNYEHIPCYAMRKKLELRNSSNIGEKMNDLIVSNRQKHNGMSWTLNGSVSMAVLKALKYNNENNDWFAKGEIPLRFAS